MNVTKVLKVVSIVLSLAATALGLVVDKKSNEEVIEKTVKEYMDSSSKS